MDSRRLDDILLLADEKFDFDLSLSSSSANEDDEVFFGPAGHKEQCAAARVGVSNHTPEGPAPKAGSHFPWSPLTGEKFVEVYREAHMLALQIGGSASRGSVSEKAADPGGQGLEVFVKESALKISLFEKGCDVEKSPTSLKRETYCLSESPLLGPTPLGLQPAAGLALRLGSTPAPQSTPAQASLPCMPEPRPSSQMASTAPPGTAPPPKRIISKLQPPRALAARGRSIPSAMEKPERERPASPSRTTFHEKESHPQVPPERPRVAPGAVPGPASSSLISGKRVPPGPSKLGLKRTLLRPPGRTGSLARKSFSSGPVPGAPPVPAQPTGGPGKSGERVSIPANSSRTLSNTRTQSRLRPTTLQRSRPMGPADASSKQTKSANVAQVTGGFLEASAASLTQSQTPENAGVSLNSTFSLPESFQPSTAKSARRQDADLESETKALHAPPNPFKTPKSSIGVSPVSATPQRSRTQRPLSCASLGRAVHSTPVRRASGPAPQSLLPSTRTPLSTKRALAMPTPASHRLSGLPFMMTRSIPRALASPQCGPVRRLSSEPRRRSGARDHLATESSRKPEVRPSDSSSQESVSPLSVVPQELHFSPEKRDFALSKNLTAEAPLPEAKTAEKASPNEAILVDLQLDQLSITPKTESKPLTDLPLIDFCNTPEASGDQCPPKPFVALASESRPLIDLMVNTPDANKDAALKPLQVVGQLIDLASPLIQLSPSTNKENVESPLLKF
ncbi:PREDICTED: G2 and S phase-expressed protein 1 [Chrysochloris asiatica]|uniref:G2 and S phase-expressed protein 1 n=1 Tax=Chrysochloris asiatica TaxID=185453 RepID=A0A9B0TN62_CHRAS|nr:PREDICTED: G2 and S phase-expressed protein 1 [Chrysochloris asiatica]